MTYKYHLNNIQIANQKAIFASFDVPNANLKGQQISHHDCFIFQTPFINNKFNTIFENTNIVLVWQKLAQKIFAPGENLRVMQYYFV